MKSVVLRTHDTALLLQQHGATVQTRVGDPLTIQEIEAETQRTRTMLPLDLAELYQEADGFSVVFSCEGVNGRLEVWPLRRLCQSDDETVFAEAAHGCFVLTRKGVFLKPIYQRACVFVAQTAAGFVDLMFERFGIDGWYFGLDEMTSRRLQLMYALQTSAKVFERTPKY